MLLIGTELAVLAGLRSEQDPPLGRTWYSNFMRRNGLKLRNPIPLSIIRAQGCSQPALKKYFDDLEVQNVEKCSC